jgi:hypothetical protein
MKENLKVSDTAYNINIDRAMHQGRLERVTLAVIAQALSAEGLEEAAEYFIEAARRLREPTILARAMAEHEARAIGK